MSTKFTMEQLKLRRSAVEGKLKRCAHRVGKIEPDSVAVEDLNAELEHLNLLWRDFRDIQNAILDLCEDVESIEPHLDQEADLERRYLHLKSSITKAIRAVAIRDNSAASASAGANSTQSSDATLTPPELHLPKGILPTFSGDYGEWNSFYDLFISSVHNNPRLTNAQRLFYLKTYTTGRAAALLKYIKVEDNAYEGAMDILKKRFDRKDQIVNHHIQRFCELPSTSIPSVAGLRKLHETADDVNRALQAIQREDRDCWLIYLLLSKVDSETRQQWSDKIAAKQAPPTFEEFLEFLEQRTYSLETAQTPTSKSTTKHAARPQPRSSSFVSTNEESKAPVKCTVCNEAFHRLYYCKRFQELSVAERIRLVKQLELCKNCLCASHGKTACTAGDCRKCKQRHHTLLHEGPSMDSVPAKGSQLSFGTVNQLSYNDCFTSVFLATAVVNVSDSSGQQHVARALLDSASQASFITSQLAKKLGIKPHRISLPLKGISGLTTRITEAVKVTIQSRVSTLELDMECAVLPKISDPIPHQYADISDWNLQPSKPLADDRFNIPGNVDLLIGASFFYELLCPERISLGPTKPLLQETALGWVVAGFYESPGTTPSSPLCFISQVESEQESSLNQLVTKFWEIETVQPVKHLTEEERFCEEHYARTMVRDTTGRYIVKLPFLQDPTAIGETGYAALAQFNSMQRQLKRDPEKYVLYCNYMEAFISASHISRLPPDPKKKPIIYVPHHGVLKADSTTTKLRVVFNASKKSSNGISLNDLLATGPVVQDTLLNLLLNFRFPLVVLTGDVEKMYLQIGVMDENADLIRMLWQEPGQPLVEYGINTVTFGMSCAPYLATRTLNQLGEDEGHNFPLAKKAVKDFYVDDLLTGAATREEAIEKRRQTTEMLKRGGFKIRKWASNDPEVLADIPEEDRAVNPVHEVDQEATLKTLGVQWQYQEDLLTFSVTCDPIQEYFTKREVLSTIAKIFDPLGLIGPVVVIAKMLMQELWKIQIDWSDPLPNAFNHRWRAYLVHLKDVWHIKVPRRCLNVEDPVRYYLHGYCDASLEVYGAALYVRAVDADGNMSSHLLCSKSRVAPINRPSLPRLELCAATLLAELIKTVQATLQVPIFQTLGYSDSTTTLAWIAGDPARWKIFVANRVASINSVLPASSWRYVPTKENPADFLTHGVAPSVLASSKLWWHGPDWTPVEPSEPVPALTPCEMDTVEGEIRKQQPILAYLLTCSDVIDELLNKHSSYTRLVRVTAWVIRFTENCQLERSQRDVGPLSAMEIRSASNFLIGYTQQQAYAAEITALQKGQPLPHRSKLWPLTPFMDGNLLRTTVAQLFAQTSINDENSLVPAGRKYPRQAKGAAGNRHDHTHIETIDVTCDQKNGMLVTIEFETDFQGVIYSQGYYNDAKCRYVSAGKGGRSFTFTVPFAGCGSKPSCSVCSSVDNVLVIQTDEDVQEAWDTARRISCSQVEQQQNTIFFKPFVVDMLEVVNVPTATGGVECWMDIQRGSYPNVSPIPSIIKIGEALSILVYLRDPKGEYDVSVKDCYAYDSPEYDASGTRRLQLSDKNGCSRKKKLFGLWEKTTQTGDSGATLVLHNNIKAFKFPDRMQVFLKCDIEICRGGCGPQVCEIEELVKAVEKPTTTRRPAAVTTLPPRRGTRPPQTVPATFPTRGRRPTEPTTVGTYTTQLPPQRTRPTRPAPPSTVAPVTRLPATTAPPRRRTRPPVTTTTEFVCTPGSTDDRCNAVLVTERPNCYRGSRDPRCRQPSTAAPVTTPAPLRCFPGSTDPRCPTVPTTPAAPRCFPGSPDPRCPTVPTTPAAPRCFPGSPDPRCPTVPTTPAAPRCFPGSTDPRCPTVPTTPAAPRCFPGSTDPRCPTVPTTPAAPRCFPGSTDPRCPSAPTTPAAPRCFPGSTDPRCPKPETTPAPLRCFPGSDDPRCPTTFRPSTTRGTRPTGRGTRPTGRGTRPTRPPTEQPTYLPPVESQKTTPAPDCYPGSNDRRCPRPVPSTPRPVEEIDAESGPSCFPGSNDPRCRTPVLRCPPGTTDPRCPSATRPAPATTRVPATTTPAPLRCYPGSPDPRCPQTTQAPRCYPGSPDPRCPRTTPTPRCYPGSRDPSCYEKTDSPTYLPPEEPTTTTSRPTTAAPRCYPGSPDPRCPQTTPRPTTPPPPRCYPGSTDPRCPQTTTTSRPAPTTTPGPRCYPGSTDPRCPTVPTTTQAPRCFPGSTDPRCPQPTQAPRCYPGSEDPRCPTTPRPTATTTPAPRCYPGSTDPRCPQTTPRPTTPAPLRCYPGSTDPRCPQTTTPRPVPTTTPTPRCYPGSTDSRCPQTTPRPTTPPPPRCFPGSTDPRCPQTTTPRPAPTTAPPPRCYPGSTDPRCPSPPPTTQAPRCFPGSTDPRCPQTTTPAPLRCYPGSTDPRCPQPTTQRPAPTTTAAPRCYPGSPDPRCPQTTPAPRCYPGSSDPRCPTTPRAPPSTTPACYPGSSDPRCPTTPRPTTQAPRCYPGSTDLRCPQTTAAPTYLPPVEPSTTAAPRCYPGSTDPRCPTPPPTTAAPRCYPGSTDPRCPQTTPRPTTPPPLRCYPGSTDPRCPQTTTPRPAPTTTPPPRCYPGSTDPRCPTTPRPQPTTTLAPRCYPGSTDPRCPQPTTTPAPRCYPGSTDLRCPQPTTTPAPRCYPGSTDPRCPTTPRPQPTTTPALRCYPGSTDPRCPQPTTTPAPRCYPGSTDPRCPTTPRPQPTTTPAPRCYPGSNDPRCPTTPRPQPTTTPALRCYPGSTDPRCPQPTTTPAPRCYPGSTDPRCPTTPRPQPTTTPAPRCYPGSTDPRCPQPTTTPAPRCYPGSTDPRCPTTPRPQPTTTPAPRCYPGSTDPRCPQPTTTPAPRCYPGSTDPRCPTTPRPQPTTTPALRCYPGSTDPRCPQPTTTPAPRCYPGSSDPRCPTTPRPQPTTTPAPRCYPGSTDPRCPQPTTTPAPRCYPGSTDPRCPTTPRPQPTTTPAPRCYPGSTDPRCPQPTTTPAPRCYPGSSDPRCPTTPRPQPTTTPAPRCYPGSTDPRCPQPTTPPAPRCYPGSTDPRCPQPTTTPAPRCYPGSTDPRCPTTPRPTTQPATYLPPVPETTAAPRCYPGSTDPRCPVQTTSRPNCYPGSTDPRCPRPVTTTPRPVPTTTPTLRCYPGSTDPRCPTTPRPSPTTTAAPVCYPGSLDPRCPQPVSTTPALRCFPGSTDPRCPTTPRPTPTTTSAPRCYPGSTDPRCPTTPRPPPTTTPAPACYPGSTDPRCPRPATTPAPRCFPGSTDPRCPTTPRPTPPTTPTLRCFPGSTDPRCPTTPRPTTTTRQPCYPGSPDPACPRPFYTTTPSACYPGSPDPNCPQPYRPSSTNPPATYLPPLPAGLRTARHLSENTLKDINALAEISDLEAADEPVPVAEDQNILERSKRDLGETAKEIISITLSVKGFQFEHL